MKNYPADPFTDASIMSRAEHELEALQMLAELQVRSGTAIIASIPENRSGQDFIMQGKATLAAITEERNRRKTMIAEARSDFKFADRVEVVALDPLFGNRSPYPPIGARGVCLGKAKTVEGGYHVRFVRADLGYIEDDRYDHHDVILMNWAIKKVEE